MLRRKNILKNFILATSLASTLFLSNNFIENSTVFADSIKIVNTSTLNVRSGSSTSHKKIGTLHKGNKVTVISTSNGWSKIKFNGKNAYVSSKYLSNVPSNNNSNDNSQSSSTKVVNTNSLNVRSGSSTSHKKIGTLHKGDKVTVVSTSNGWSKIKFNGKNAYVSSKYLSNVPSGNSSILNVPFINQYPNLPLGCEATSLAQILSYKGVSVTKTKIADEMLKSPNKNPNLGFVGSPYRNEKGIFQTIYPKALESTAKKYRPNSEDITGASVDTLEKELKKGNPSVIWVSRNFSNPEMGYWYEGTKDQMWVNKNLHVVAVTGVDSNYFYITDPAQGKYKVSKSKFKDVYYTVGKKALVVR